MNLKKVKTIFALCALALPLGACGEAWEMQLTKTSTPYGQERTAGSGVAYVLVHMAPKKDMQLQAVDRKIEPKAMNAKKGEEVFRNKLRK